MPAMAIARALLASLACLGAVACGGCGGSSRIGEDLPRQDARLMLDAPVGAVHAGIALAAERGFDRGEGVRLRLRRPGPGGALAALRRGQVEAVIVPIDELIALRARGVDAVGVMALVQKPLTTVLTEEEVESGRDLEGRRVALGDGSAALGVLRSVVAADGGDIERVRVVSAGSAAVEQLESGRVGAAVVDRIADGVPARARRRELRQLAPEDNGVPVHPELVVAVDRPTLLEDASVVRALIRALQRGYREAQIDPESAATALAGRGAREDRVTLLAQLDAVGPAWTAGAGAYGRLRPGALRSWARWAVAAGVLERRPDVAEAFATDLVSRQSTP
jgi:ABC-type nitrate/sulfonate/bicarbonate transport system substrate-binding protein